MTWGRKFTEWRERRAAEREANLQHLATTPVRSLHRGTYSGTTHEIKANPVIVRSEPYRRMVADMPCICCGKPGPSQCAHANTGKGMGMKASDLDTFPLCADCHRDFDQGAMFSKADRRDIERQWIEQTQAAITRSV